jgi:hypothetical protein
VRARAIVAVVVIAVAAVAVAGLALARRGDDQGVVPDRIQRAIPSPNDRSAAPHPSSPPAAGCPAELAGCREVLGRIVYVERVDPDGDGDAHFVLADSAGVTGPGITVVDVRADLRPQPLPGIGDHLSAAGAVATGSYGQRQIEAVAVGSVGPGPAG